MGELFPLIMFLVGLLVIFIIDETVFMPNVNEAILTLVVLLFILLRIYEVVLLMELDDIAPYLAISDEGNCSNPECKYIIDGECIGTKIQLLKEECWYCPNCRTRYKKYKDESAWKSLSRLGRA